MWLNQYPFTLQKAPGGNMSYIPPWVPSGSTGGHYPPHMLPPQQPSTTPHSPQSTLSSSPLGSPQMYQSLSPVNKSHLNSIMITQSSSSPKSSSAPPPSVSSSVSSSTASVTQAAAAAAAAVAAAVAASSSLVSSSSPDGAIHGNSRDIESQYEQGVYGHHRSLSPSSKLQLAHHDIKSEMPGLHNLPELALGLAGPSAFDPKTHRKYVRSSPTRSPGKYPAPEQLSSPVMYSYQGRGRPRKHFTHATGLPTMVPVTHPSHLSVDDDDEENKPFKCNVCCKGFKLKGGLQQHERTHSTDRPYVCPDCGKLFRQPTHLQQHLRIHTGEKPYDCTFCDKSFRQRTILNQHLRIHTGEKPYVCMECGKQFRQKAILDQHYRTHLGDKPYACPHPSCRKHFREMASLISHMKCHKDVPDPKIVLQQAKRLIKEEKLDEYGNPEGGPVVGTGVSGNIEVLTVPHPPGLSNNNNGNHERDLTPHDQHNGRSFPTIAASVNQRSPHSLHSQSHPTNNVPLSEGQSFSHSGMMPSSPQMAMANLIPYPHSIFPSASYMMTSPDPRQYHPLSGSLSSSGSSHPSSLQSRPNQSQ